MIEIQLKDIKDFKRLARSHKTVYFKENCKEFTYYVISEQAGVGVVNMFKSQAPLKIKENFHPEKPEEIPVEFLVEIESIAPLLQPAKVLQ